MAARLRARDFTAVVDMLDSHLAAGGEADAALCTLALRAAASACNRSGAAPGSTAAQLLERALGATEAAFLTPPGASPSSPAPMSARTVDGPLVVQALRCAGLLRRTTSVYRWLRTAQARGLLQLEAPSAPAPPFAHDREATAAVQTAGAQALAHCGQARAASMLLDRVQVGAGAGSRGALAASELLALGLSGQAGETTVSAVPEAGPVASLTAAAGSDSSAAELAWRALTRWSRSDAGGAPSAPAVVAAALKEASAGAAGADRAVVVLALGARWLSPEAVQALPRAWAEGCVRLQLPAEVQARGAGIITQVQGQGRA